MVYTKSWLQVCPPKLPVFPHLPLCKVAGTQGDGLLSYWGAELSVLCLFLLDGALQGNQEGISLIQWACCTSQHFVPMNRANTHTHACTHMHFIAMLHQSLCVPQLLYLPPSPWFSNSTPVYSLTLFTFFFFFFRLKSNTIAENKTLSDCSVFSNEVDFVSCGLCSAVSINLHKVLVVSF